MIAQGFCRSDDRGERIPSIVTPHAITCQIAALQVRTSSGGHISGRSRSGAHELDSDGGRGPAPLSHRLISHVRRHASEHARFHDGDQGPLTERRMAEYDLVGTDGQGKISERRLSYLPSID